MAADPIWKKKLMEALGFTPRYDINIGQRGKVQREALARWEAKSAALAETEGREYSGRHPGVESGYQGGLDYWKKPGNMTEEEYANITSEELSTRGTFKGKWGSAAGFPDPIMNKNPTQVGWNKPSIKGGAGGGFKRVLKHLAAMESPGPDWSLEAKKSGVTSPWSPTNVAWSPVGGTMLDWKKKRTA